MLCTPKCTLYLQTNKGFISTQTIIFHFFSLHALLFPPFPSKSAGGTAVCAQHPVWCFRNRLQSCPLLESRGRCCTPGGFTDGDGLWGRAHTRSEELETPPENSSQPRLVLCPSWQDQPLPLLFCPSKVWPSVKPLSFYISLPRIPVCSWLAPAQSKADSCFQGTVSCRYSGFWG